MRTNISDFIKKIDESKVLDTELLSETEINQVNEVINEMEANFQSEIDKLKDDSDENKKLVELLNEELRYVKKN